MKDDDVVDRFEAQLHAQIQESVDRVEQDTADELYQRRMAALQQAASSSEEAKTKGWTSFGLVPAGVTAAAAIAMVTFLSQTGIEEGVNETPTVAITEEGQPDPIVNQNIDEALTETMESEAVWDESFEMLDEMEFYAWMAEQEYAG